MFHYGSGTVATARSSNFNPPARDGDGHRLSCPCRDFNPPTRKGWDVVGVNPLDGVGISIHPPARGGTNGRKRENLSQLFQSTHPQGVGRQHDVYCDRQRRISIHPPARGGTRRDQQSQHRCVYFNPPTRKGWDPCSHLQNIQRQHFNPPTRKGWDDLPDHRRLRHGNFNPPTRKGWDWVGKFA